MFFSTAVSFIFLIFKYKSAFSKRNILIGTIAVFVLSTGVLFFYSSLDTTRKNYFLSKIPVWEYFRSYENASAQMLLKKKNAKANLTQIAPFDFSEEYYENANLRIIFWKKSLCLIKSNPILGVGSGNWRINIPSCKEPVNPEHTLKNFTYSQPHNEWIGIISELGIVGFILSLFLYFIPIAIIFYRLIFTVRKPHISVLFYASFIFGFYLYSSFDFPLKRVEHNVIFFAVFAFLLQKIQLKPVKCRILHSARSFPPSLFSLFLILMLMLSVFIASVRIRSEYFTLKMFRNEKQNDDNEIHYCQKAENIFYRITPNALPVAWFEGVAYYRKGDVNSALTCFKRALKSTPFEVRVLNDYAASLFQLHEIKDAKGVLLHAIDIDPYFDDAKFNLGAIYYFAGQKDSAFYYITRCSESQKREDFLQELKK